MIAACPQYSVRFVESRIQIRNVLQHLAGHHDVDRFFRKCQTSQIFAAGAVIPDVTERILS